MSNKKLCARLTKKTGSPCKNFVVAGSDFCCRHQPKEIAHQWIAGLLISAFLGWLTSYFFYVEASSGLVAEIGRLKKENEELILHVSNVQTPRQVPYLRSSEFVIIDGSNVHVSRMNKWIPLTVNSMPFEVGVSVAGKILLRGEIKSPNGSVALVMDNDELRVFPDKNIDVNSDQKSIEVVDENLKPFFQIEVLSLNEYKTKLDALIREGDAGLRERLEKHLATLEDLRVEMRFSNNFSIIKLSYITPRGDGWVFVSHNGVIGFRDKSKMIELQQNGIPRLFEYPGYENRGVRFLNTGDRLNDR